MADPRWMGTIDRTPWHDGRSVGGDHSAKRSHSTPSPGIRRGASVAATAGSPWGTLSPRRDRTGTTRLRAARPNPPALVLHGVQVTTVPRWSCGVLRGVKG